MFTYPYQTTVLSGVVMKAVVAELAAAAIRQDLIPVTTPEGEKVPGLYEVPASLKDIRPFYHPVMVTPPTRDLSIVVIDTRAFTRQSQTEGQVITNPAEYNLARMRGILTQIWNAYGRGPTDFLALGDLPAKVFTTTLTNAIVRRFGLSMSEWQTLSILIAFYYYSLFIREPQEMRDQALLNMVRRINRVTRVNSEVVLRQLEGKHTLTDIRSLCEFIAQEMPSSRLAELKPGIMVTLVGGIWYGAQAREIVAVSMEYPPYFLAMCYIAATDRGYNKSYLGKEAIAAGQRDNALESFVRALNNLVREWVTND